jgi:D-alanyl-D-alanine carboxypeptidase
MAHDRLSRRSFLAASGLSASAVAAAGTSFFWTAELRGQMPMPKATGPLNEKLDAYVAAYMAAMNAPGLTLGLTDADKTLRTACYGYANVDRRLPVSADHLFEIGSITKSFVALVLLSLRDEGKLDPHKPLLDYLPTLPITSEFGVITIHHLLTHTSGLPDNMSVFSADPAARLVQGFKPGEHFHYCNAGFGILGMLAEKLDGRPWRIAVEERIFKPLGMTQTRGVITTADRGRAATGYQSFWDDQVYPRQGRLSPAPNMVMDDTAGCIQSTPGDMERYARMLLNRGRGPNGRIVSEESFGLMATPYIKAAELSPTASYGYGIAVDTLDGHKILRHTGGMVSFASSIHVDLDGGVACFASINAMQGYRPTAVTEYAVRLAWAQKESRTLPTPPVLADPQDVDNAADYAGTFTAPDGRKLVFAAKGKRLTLMNGETAIGLQHAGGDAFLSTREGEFALHMFIFGRKQVPESAPASAPTPAAVAPVIEVAYGGDWYAGAAYDGPRTFTVPQDYALFTGQYRSDSPWGGDAKVYVVKDRLVVEGTRLTRIGGSLFRVGDEDWWPLTAEFKHIFEGKARLMWLGGADYWRVDVG